jgi:hypothetical protein
LKGRIEMEVGGMYEAEPHVPPIGKPCQTTLL